MATNIKRALGTYKQSHVNRYLGEGLYATDACQNRCPTDQSGAEGLYIQLVCSRESGHDGPHMMHNYPVKETNIFAMWEDYPEHMKVASEL